MELYRRHRRKLLGAAAVSAAGAAAYYTYKWWIDGRSLEDILSRYANELPGGPQSPLSNQEALQRHFASIQHIPEQKTVPTLIPTLQKALMQAADTSQIKEQLRKMKGDSNSSEAKMQLWTELTHTSFVLAASTAWALPLLDLLLRVQVNVLGRCLYCASLEQQPGVEPPQQPTQTEQQYFLGIVDTLAQSGVPQIVETMRSCVDAVIGGLELTQPIDGHMVSKLLADIHSGFEAANGSKGWESFLLAEDDHLATPLVAEMISEVRSVVSSTAYNLALQDAVREATDALSKTVAAAIGPQALPFARAIPKIDAAADSLLATPDNATVRAIGQLPAVAELCAFAYAPLSSVSS